MTALFPLQHYGYNYDGCGCSPAPLQGSSGDYGFVGIAALLAGIGAAGASAVGVTGLSAGALAAITGGAAAAGVAGSAVALSYRATARNVVRLRKRLAKLKAKRAQLLRAAKGKPGKVKRIRARYDRRIRAAEKRLDRIERVMAKRIQKRRQKGKPLTKRQQRMQAAMARKKAGKRKRNLGSKSRGVPVDAYLSEEEEDVLDLDAEIAAAEADIEEGPDKRVIAAGAVTLLLVSGLAVWGGYRAGSRKRVA